jgi:hypothetical protein
MTRDEVIRRINELLDSTDPETANTSMRIPRALRDAATLAVKELDVAPSTTVMTANALRSFLEAVVMQAALDQHYQEHPETRPSLADLAVAAAELDGHPLAAQPDVIRHYAAELVKRHPDAGPEDVLLWAEARMFTARSRKADAA